MHIFWTAQCTDKENIPAMPVVKLTLVSKVGPRTILHTQATEKLHQLKKKVFLPCLWQSLLLTLNRNWAFLSKLAVWLIASNLVVWC